MKILIVGAGGIGSNFVPELCNCLEQGQINSNTEIYVADDDLVELEQIKYQNFTCEEAGMNKAEALAKRFKACGVTAIKKMIMNGNDLKPYHIIILCVDNEPTREMVINYCFDKNKQFLDLRATGRIISAFPKFATREENLKFVDKEYNVSYSCQDEETLRQGMVDKGNKIVAYCGIQMLLNHLRGKRNRAISLLI